MGKIKDKRLATTPQERRTLHANFKVAITAIAVVGLLSFFLQVYQGLNVEVPVLSSAKDLKDAFFSGQPWLLQCVGGNIPVHDLTKEVAQILVQSSSIRVGALACSQKMPSGNTFWKRFGIPQRPLSIDAPLLFFAANGENPKMVDPTFLTDAAALADHVIDQANPRIFPVKNDPEFKKLCLKRKVCVVFIGEGEFVQPPWLTKLLHKHRAVRMVSVDAEVHRLSFEVELSLSKIPTTPANSPHVVVLRPSRSSKTNKVKGGGVTLHSEKFDATDLGVFFETVLTKGRREKELQVTPGPHLISRQRNTASSSSQQSKKDNEKPKKSKRVVGEKERSRPPPTAAPAPAPPQDGHHHIKVEQVRQYEEELRQKQQQQQQEQQQQHQHEDEDEGEGEGEENDNHDGVDTSDDSASHEDENSL